MLGRKHLKQAILEIGQQDPDTGYALDQMLAMDRIGPVSPENTPEDDGDLYFLFQGSRVTVRRGSFFQHGTLPIQQQLLIKYGEMAGMGVANPAEGRRDFHAAAVQTRLAGLKMAVDHEIARALSRLGASGASMDEIRDTMGLLEEMAADDARNFLLPSFSAKEKNRPALFSGSMEKGADAAFIRFPFTKAALIQVADINLEFFCVRTVLDILIRGKKDRLFAAQVRQTITGLMYLAVKQQFFHTSLEINTIATISANRDPESILPAPVTRGVGAFLVAGAFLVWKTRYPRAKELVLDSELGARRFYDRMGFAARGMSEFVFHKPAGRLIPCLIIMAGQVPDLPPKVVKLVLRLIKGQVELLAKKQKPTQTPGTRERALAAIRACLAGKKAGVFFQATVNELKKCQDRIPEAPGLLSEAEKPCNGNLSL